MEFAHKPFASQETSDQATASFADVEFQGVLKGDDVPGVDGVVSVDLKAMDRTIAAQVQLASPRALDPKHRLSAEQCR